MLVSIRKFREDDVDFILNNWVGTDKLDGVFKTATKESIQEMIEYYSQGYKNGKFMYGFCVETDGKIAGWMSFAEKEEGTPNFGIALDKAYRRKGVATRAFELAKNFLLEKGAKRITSSCAEDNTASEKMHQKLGFEEIKRELSPKGHPMIRWQMAISEKEGE